jgi:hypothetical protein
MNHLRSPRKKLILRADAEQINGFDRVNYHRQRRWLDILALEGALLGLVVILYFGALAFLFIVFCTTEMIYFELIITNHAANYRSKIQCGAPKTLSSSF